MANLKSAQHIMIGIIAVLFTMSVIFTICAGVRPAEALLDAALDSLEVSYVLIPFAVAANPLILLAKILDAGIFPILAVILAAWFFDFINSINFRERTTLSRLKRMSGHVIVVPSNSFARALLKELKSSSIEGVAIAENRREMRQIHNENLFAIAGDIKSMDTFEIAGIKRARCLVACSKDDIQNALIAITAKTANPRIKIIVRADKDENRVKLMRAGAHKVIVPGNTAGIDMGNEIVKRVLERKAYKKA
jgi:voltage-gated potassium channel